MGVATGMGCVVAKFTRMTKCTPAAAAASAFAIQTNKHTNKYILSSLPINLNKLITLYNLRWNGKNAVIEIHRRQGVATTTTSWWLVNYGANFMLPLGRCHKSTTFYVNSLNNHFHQCLVEINWTFKSVDGRWEVMGKAKGELISMWSIPQF